MDFQRKKRSYFYYIVFTVVVFLFSKVNSIPLAIIVSKTPIILVLFQ